MKFDMPAGTNPIDRMQVVGKATPRIDGPVKVSGLAPYAYEHQDLPAKPVYGYIVGSAIAKGAITSLDTARAERASGVLAVITHRNSGALGKGNMNTAHLLGGPKIEHYHQAIALVVAGTWEQARAAASLINVEYTRENGRFDLEHAKPDAADLTDRNAPVAVGDFEGAFTKAAVQLDQTYTTPDHTHAMMEPFATIAAWEGDKLTVWTSNQMVNWGVNELALTLQIPAENIRLLSPYVGGGFGGKLFLRTDAVLAALGAKTVKRPVKVAMTRGLIANNSTHRPATIQRLRLGCEKNGKITAIAHESWSGDLEGGSPELATQQTQYLYAGANRFTAMRLAVLDLPEGGAMRAPGEAPGMMALEAAIDEMAEKLGMDPIAFRVLNDTQVDPGNPQRPFSQRNFVRCLEDGAREFGWNARKSPGKRKEGRWLIGMGVAAAFRNNINMKSAARVRLNAQGRVTVETDMTDIGTGSYTILAQTAAEMLGVPLAHVDVKLGDSASPVSAGSGGQWGANSATSGVYAACVKLREAVVSQLGLGTGDAVFEDGQVRIGSRSAALKEAASSGELVAEDAIEFAKLSKTYLQSTFGAHFVEVAVDRFTGETRVRRMLAVCDAGRILNPMAARSQLIGAMTMGVGGALMEELAVDTRFGFFVNHDLAGYEVPVHADIPHQQVIFLDEADDKVSPMKAKGVGELGLCGVGAAVANAIYNATGIRVREYPLTLDKYLDQLPDVA